MIRDVAVYKVSKGGKFDFPSWTGTGGEASFTSAKAAVRRISEPRASASGH